MCFANGQQITNINGSGNDYLVCALGDIDLDRLYFTQSADTFILVHEDMSPKSIVRGGSNSTWTFSTISLTSPKHAFLLYQLANPSATITPDAVDGTVNISASSSIFTSSHVDQYINVLNGFGQKNYRKNIRNSSKGYY